MKKKIGKDIKNRVKKFSKSIKNKKSKKSMKNSEKQIKDKNGTYQRFINNKILNNCRRPHRKDWCGPTTVAEIVQILTGRDYTVDQIAEINDWTPEIITGGKLGTKSIIKGVSKCSDRIVAEELAISDDLNSWNKLKESLSNRDRVIYYHEPGHHLLLCGFIEEPLIDRQDIWNHQNIGRVSDYEATRRWLIKAEHNVKKEEYIDQGVLVPVEFSTVCKNLDEKDNLFSFHLGGARG